MKSGACFGKEPHVLRDLGGPRGWDGTGYHYECQRCGRKFVRRPAGVRIAQDDSRSESRFEAKEAA